MTLHTPYFKNKKLKLVMTLHPHLPSDSYIHSKSSPPTDVTCITLDPDQWYLKVANAACANSPRLALWSICCFNIFSSFYLFAGNTCDLSPLLFLSREGQPFPTVGCLHGTCLLLQVVFWGFPWNAQKFGRDFSALLELIVNFEGGLGPDEKSRGKAVFVWGGVRALERLTVQVGFWNTSLLAFWELLYILVLGFVFNPSNHQLCVHWGCKVTCVAPLYTHQVESRI